MSDLNTRRLFIVKLNIDDIILAATVLNNSLIDIVNAKRKNSSKLNIKLSITHDANELNIYLTTVGENEYLNITLYIFIGFIYLIFYLTCCEICFLIAMIAEQTMPPK